MTTNIPAAVDPAGRYRSGCAAISRGSNESLRGTVATAVGWLLIEHPGPWGPAPFEPNGPLGEIGAELHRRCTELRVRIQLIRDPNRPRTNSGDYRTYLVHSGRSGPWMTQHHYHRPEQLLDIDIATAVSTTPPQTGKTACEPVYLVCTHGKKDPCCAVFGRPIVRTLTTSTLQVFESSHLGGDRFAGGIVALPDGSYFGHLEPNSAATVIERHHTGHLLLSHYRGRCTDSPLVQVAEHSLRTLQRLSGIDDVHPRKTIAGEPDNIMELATRSATATVHVRSAPQPPRATACHAAAPLSPDHGKVTAIHITDII